MPALHMGLCGMNRSVFKVIKMAIVLASGGNNSATYTFADNDTSFGATQWGLLSATANARIKELLDTVYTDIVAGDTAVEQFEAALLDVGVSLSFWHLPSSAGSVAAPVWGRFSVVSGSRPVLTVQDVGAGNTAAVRISLSYSASE